jgi:hypothetical protein
MEVIMNFNIKKMVVASVVAASFGVAQAGITDYLPTQQTFTGLYNRVKPYMPTQGTVDASIAATVVAGVTLKALHTVTNNVLAASGTELLTAATLAGIAGYATKYAYDYMTQPTPNAQALAAHVEANRSATPVRGGSVATNPWLESPSVGSKRSVSRFGFGTIDRTANAQALTAHVEANRSATPVLAGSVHGRSQYTGSTISSPSAIATQAAFLAQQAVASKSPLKRSTTMALTVKDGQEWLNR